MPGREDPEEPAFVEVRQENADVGRQLSESRDMTPVGVAAREPFESSEALANPSHADVKSDDAEPSTDEVVSNLVIHEDRPIENLPTMSAPELKLIGRCVSLCVMRKVDSEEEPFYYTGLVASVTFAAVTLMYVNRYTRSDFKSYMAREKQVSKAGPQAAVEGEVGAGSLAAAVRLLTEDEIGAAEPVSSRSPAAAAAAAQTPTRALWHKKFRESTGSVGPLPYVTFLRKNIHDVAFGRDPRSSFYSLFQDPSKQLLDMQYLRMFVRRYLVHTSEGNNPRQVPLYAFVTVRCACPSVDRELVSRVAREELPGLMKADKSIEKEKKEQRAREIRREQEIQGFQAPSGLFSQTGILYVTRLPQVTFVTGILILFFVAIFVVYVGVSMGVMDDRLIYAYEQELLRYFIASIVVWAITGVIVVLHSIYARVTLRTSLTAMILRCIWSVGSIACAAMVMAVTVERLRNEKMYTFMVSASSYDLCDFYWKYKCSGFWTVCPFDDSDLCTFPCAQLAASFANACYPDVWNRVQQQLIPLIVFDAFLLLLFLYSVFMLWKLWSTANKISARIR